MKRCLYIFMAVIYLSVTIFSCTDRAKRVSENIKSIDRPIKFPDSIIVKNGVIVSAYGFDISQYGDYHIDEAPEGVYEITIDHIICIAVENCDLEMLRGLVERGANPNTICDVDHIVTEVAFCDENAVEITDFLIKNGTDINGSDEDNDSFLSYAISNDNIELVKYIMNNGGNVKQQMVEESIGCYPFHSIQSVDMFNLLEKEFKNIGFNLRCRNGRTLLHQSIRDDLRDLSTYLILNKIIDVQIKDMEGLTALDYANKYNRKEIMELFQNK